MCEVCDMEDLAAVRPMLSALIAVDVNDPRLTEIGAVQDNYGDFADLTPRMWSAVWNTLVLSKNNRALLDAVQCEKVKLMKRNFHTLSGLDPESMTLLMCETIAHVRDVHNITF